MKHKTTLTGYVSHAEANRRTIVSPDSFPDLRAEHYRLGRELAERIDARMCARLAAGCTFGNAWTDADWTEYRDGMREINRMMQEAAESR